MAITRSPKSPAIPLDKAISLAGKLWGKEKKTAVTPEIVAKAWGYKGVSGVVRSQIGALRQYGLLDGTKEGVKISDLALEILVQPKESKARSTAISIAALNPPLFSEIYKALPDASDDTLKAHLITKKGFSEDAATRFISSFRDTISFASIDSSAYNEQETQAETWSDMRTESRAPSHEPTRPPQPGTGGLSLMVPFRGSYLSVKIETSDRSLTKEHIARVRAYLELAEDDLNDDDGEPE